METLPVGHLIITEGVSGVWFYHWSEPANFTRSLCGKWTMKTSLRPEHWGIRCGNERITYKWCEECVNLARTR